MADFKTKREHWISILTGTDQHSISRQLVAMAWDIASFDVILRARQMTQPDPRGGFKVNGLIHDLLDRGFFTVQLLAIRRLNDTYKVEGPRATWSLRGLLDDIKRNRHLMSRASIFAAEGLEYNYEDVAMRRRDWHANKRHGMVFLPRDLDSNHVLWRHQVISVLAGNNGTPYTPDDTISEHVIDNLCGKVDAACKKAETFVNKFLAHAAAPEDRAQVNADDLDITFENLKTAYQHLCQTSAFVSIFFFGQPHPNYLPIAQYDLWEYFTLPLATEDQVADLREAWSSFDRSSHNWTSWGLDGYLAEFPG